MSTIMASIDEEDVHEFNLDDDLDLLPIDSYDPIDVPLPAPAPAEVQANSRFLSEPASANRAPRFSNPTIERMNSFKYRNTPKENSTQASSEPTAAPIHDPRQIYQSSYNNVETRQRSAVPATALRKLGSPKSSESLVQKNISSPPQPPSIQSTPPARPPRPVTVAHVKVEEPRKIKPQPAVEVISTKRPVTPVPQVRSTTPTSQSRPSRISQPRPAQHIVSPTPAANIPEPQPVSVPPRDRSAPKGERVSIFKRPLPTTDLLSPIRTRNAVEASASATSSSRSTTPTSGRSLTPSSLRRSRLSVTNSQEISIAGTKSENGGGGWNSCVRVKGKTPVDDAIDNITRVKQESGEKAIEKPRRHTPLRSVGSLSQHDMSNVYPRNTDPVPVPSAQFFSPKIGSTSRSGTPTSSRPASRSTTPTIHSRPVSRSTTPTNVPQRRRPSLGSYMASDDMSEVSRGVDSLNGRSQRSASGRSPGRHTTPASASLLSPYNLMVAGNRTLDSHSMSDADLKSVGNQLLLLKLMLQHKATEDAAQDEEDILRAWQIVHATEEQARALSKHDVGVEEVEKVHQQIHDMEVLVDKVNDHLAPVFERLRDYIHVKHDLSEEQQRQQDGAESANAEDKAASHRELQARLVGLSKSIAALKRSAEQGEFVPPTAAASPAHQHTNSNQNAQRARPTTEAVTVQRETPSKATPAAKPVYIPTSKPRTVAVETVEPPVKKVPVGKPVSRPSSTLMRTTAAAKASYATTTPTAAATASTPPTKPAAGRASLGGGRTPVDVSAKRDAVKISPKPVPKAAAATAKSITPTPKATASTKATPSRQSVIPAPAPAAPVNEPPPRAIVRAKKPVAAPAPEVVHVAQEDTQRAESETHDAIVSETEYHNDEHQNGHADHQDSIAEEQTGVRVEEHADEHVVEEHGSVAAALNEKDGDDSGDVEQEAEPEAEGQEQVLEQVLEQVGVEAEAQAPVFAEVAGAASEEAQEQLEQLEQQEQEIAGVVDEEEDVAPCAEEVPEDPIEEPVHDASADTAHGEEVAVVVETAVTATEEVADASETQIPEPPEETSVTTIAEVPLPEESSVKQEAAPEQSAEVEVEVQMDKEVEEHCTVQESDIAPQQAVEASAVTTAPEPQQEVSVDAHLDSMFDLEITAADSQDVAEDKDNTRGPAVLVDAAERAITPEQSALLGGIAAADADAASAETKDSAAIASAATTAAVEVDLKSPDRKARSEAFTRLMRRLNQNKEDAASASDNSPAPSQATSAGPATPVPPSAAVDTEAAVEPSQPAEDATSTATAVPDEAPTKEHTVTASSNGTTILPVSPGTEESSGPLSMSVDFNTTTSTSYGELVYSTDNAAELPSPAASELSPAPAVQPQHTSVLETSNTAAASTALSVETAVETSADVTGADATTSASAAVTSAETETESPTQVAVGIRALLSKFEEKKPSSASSDASKGSNLSNPATPNGGTNGEAPQQQQRLTPKREKSFRVTELMSKFDGARKESPVPSFGGGVGSGSRSNVRSSIVAIGDISPKKAVFEKDGELAAASAAAGAGAAAAPEISALTIESSLKGALPPVPEAEVTAAELDMPQPPAAAATESAVNIQEDVVDSTDGSASAPIAGAESTVLPVEGKPDSPSEPEVVPPAVETVSGAEAVILPLSAANLAAPSLAAAPTLSFERLPHPASSSGKAPPRDDDTGSNAGSNAGSEVSTASKKARRPTLKGLWKRVKSASGINPDGIADDSVSQYNDSPVPPPVPGGTPSLPPQQRKNSVSLNDFFSSTVDGDDEEGGENESEKEGYRYARGEESYPRIAAESSYGEFASSDSQIPLDGDAASVASSNNSKTSTKSKDKRRSSVKGLWNMVKGSVKN